MGLLLCRAMLGENLGDLSHQIHTALGIVHFAAGEHNGHLHLVARIEEIVMAEEEIVGIHDLIVHNYGPGRVMISLHAEVPADGDILALHDIIDNVEHRLKEELYCAAVIHMDPVSTKDEETLKFASAAAACNLFEANSIDGMKSKEEINEMAKNWVRL